MKTTNIFEIYNNITLTKELRLKIRSLKNEILKKRYPNACFTTEEHEQALNEACLHYGIIL